MVLGAVGRRLRHTDSVGVSEDVAAVESHGVAEIEVGSGNERANVVLEVQDARGGEQNEVLDGIARSDRSVVHKVVLDGECSSQCILIRIDAVAAVAAK